MKVIAALYVETDGPYADLEGVDAWSIERDARRYSGPHPVVAHPPCKRWGNYWYGSPSSPTRYNLGDDDGCFAHALYAVRTFGGVIEHPEGSAARAWFGLPDYPRLGWGWRNQADKYGGRSCLVTQGRYGHASRKATWLYAVLPTFPALDFDDCRNMKPVEHLDKRGRFITPLPFRDALLDMARSC